MINIAGLGQLRARNTDPETSHEAARHVNGGKRVREIIEAFDVLGPSTATEIQKACLYKQRDYASPHMRRLCRAGLLRDTGNTKIVDTRCPQIVWEITEEGKEWLHA